MLRPGRWGLLLSESVLGGRVKKKFSTEFAYVCGIVLIAMGVVFMEKADFGVSMIVAPAYLLYLWLSQFWGFFTFGMAEYTVQAILLVVMMLVIRRFRVPYLFSFVTAVIYGFVLDGFMMLGVFLPDGIFWLRVVYYLIGLGLTGSGVAFMFHTYIPPEVYELFVKEVSARFDLDINKFKTAYDCASCLVGIAMSFLFFGLWNFVGVNVGTVVCALVNGFVISRFSALYEKHWEFCDRFGWRRFFEGQSESEEA